MAVYKDVISIFGGTSFLALELIATLIPEGWSINVFTNNPNELKVNLEKNGLMSPKIRLINGYERINQEVLETSYFIINMMQGPIGFKEDDKIYKNAFKNFIEVASKCKESQILHLSCLGANSLLRFSPYLKEKGRQEDTIRLRIANPTILRTGILFGKEDIVFNSFANYFKKNRILYLSQEAKTKVWQLCYIRDAVLAIRKILNQPEIYTNNTYELHSGEKFSVWKMIARVSDYTGFYGCSVAIAPKSILNFGKKIPFLARYIGINPKFEVMLKSSFVSTGDNKTKTLFDLNIKPTTSREVMPLYLFRN